MIKSRNEGRSQEIELRKAELQFRIEKDAADRKERQEREKNEREERQKRDDLDREERKALTEALITLIKNK